MSDGGSWNPGPTDPRYDPYSPPPQPPRYGPPNQRQGRGPQGGQGGGQGGYGPGPQGQNYGQDDRGQDYGPDYGRGGYGGEQGGAFRPPPQRGPRPQGRPQGPDPRRSPYGPGPEDARAADAWSVPSSAQPADPWDEPDPATRSGRRRSASRQGESATPQEPGHVNDDIDLDEVDPDGKAQRAWAKTQAAAGAPKSKAKKATVYTSIGLCLVLLAGVGYAGYVYETTVGSLHHTALTPPGTSQAPLPPDPYGNTAENILLIGSDTRDDSADCALGGDCSRTDSADNVGANADSEMILHISAERTNATILSIPRDTEANLPNCTEKDGKTQITGTYSTYQINNALQYGPECQVWADHILTGITISDYIMFDFSGIVTMSNALGGVPVCVTKSVNDKNSGLKLQAGTSTIKGDQALEFLRTRDSFFDGSDLGREETTHYFLGQLIQTLRKSLNFSNLGTLLSIGQAAAKSTTVSDNLAGLPKLEGLVSGLNKIPTNNITFLTMPNDLDPTNNSRVVVDPSAQSLFKAIQDDTSFTSTSKAPTAKTTPSQAPTTAAPPSVNKAQVPVNVYNADGVGGRATTIVDALETDGFTNTVSQGNASPVGSSLVYYDPNETSQAQAQAVAAALGISNAQVQSTTQFRGVSVFIGGDFQSGTKLGAAGSSGSKPVVSAPPVSHESFASGTENECIPVESGNLNIVSK